jgi:hypothetical protein
MCVLCGDDESIDEDDDILPKKTKIYRISITTHEKFLNRIFILFFCFLLFSITHDVYVKKKREA